MKNSKISWTDHTFNPWVGCEKVSPACKNCYAMELVNRFGGDFLGRRVVKAEAGWGDPLKWNREAEAGGVRKKVFCASLADVFEGCSDSMLNHEGRRIGICLDCGSWEPTWVFCSKCGSTEQEDLTMEDVRYRLFRLIDSTPNLDWLLLTKRPENILKMWSYRVSDYGQDDNPVVMELLKNPDRTKALKYRPNVWLGTTVENQDESDKRIPELMKCRDLSPVLFLSCEPLLEPIELKLRSRVSHFPRHNGPSGAVFDREHLPFHWVIVGGESGPDYRYMSPHWVQSLHDQCKSAGIPFFCKQGSGPKSGQQYDLPDHLFSVKEFPCPS